MIMFLLFSIVMIQTSAIPLNNQSMQYQCISGFKEFGCNATNWKSSELAVTEGQKYWNLGLWFAALFGKEYLVRDLMTENTKFIVILSNKQVSEFYKLFYTQFGRMLGIGGLMGLIKYASISHNALLRKEETRKLLQSYLNSHRFYDALFNSDINDTDHRVSTDVSEMVESKINMMNKGLMIPFLVIYYTYQVWKEMALMGLLSIYGFFLISVIFIRILMVPVSTVLQKKEDAEAEYR